MKLFDGLKVLDVGTWIAGPVATTILADFGAEVIKVEIPRTGDPYRQLPTNPGTPKTDVNYTWLLDGRNKRSISLNLKHESGKDILKRLVKHCDIYVTNQPMGARRRLGLTYEELSPLNERMIYASLTAYGEQGPEAEKEGFDGVAYWTRSGLADLVRTPGGPPAGSVAGQGDHPTAVALFASIMMALYRRQITGRGGMVSTSLLANGYWANSCFGQAALAGADLSDRRDPDSELPWIRRFYRTSDKRLIQFYMVRSGADQEHLIRELEHEALLSDPRFADVQNRLKHSNDLYLLIQQTIEEASSEYWLHRLTEAGINTSRVAIVEDMIDDQQAIATGVISPPVDDVGVPLVINPPLFVEGLERAGVRKAPDVGEHTDDILQELGFSAESIATLRAEGIV